MKLYHHPFSQNCRRVVATIYENGREDVELIQVDLMKGENRQPDFLAINPNGKVPVLVDGELNLWESTAIMQYLSSDSPLWPPSRARYDIIRWQCWGIAHFGPAASKVVWERMVKPMMGSTPDEAKIAEGLADFERFGKVLDDHLQGRDWLVGDEITLADLSVAAELSYAGPAQLDLGPFANIRRWYGAIESRPSWQKTTPPMG